MEKQERVCCNCGNNERVEGENGIECYCSVDKRKINYLECFEGWCPHWKKDRTWDKEKDFNR